MIRALAIGAAVSVVVVVVAIAKPFEPSVSGAKGAATGDVARGGTLFASTCAGCHAAAGISTATVGPDVTNVPADVALAKIAAGGGVMPAGLATGQDAVDIAAFVDSLDGTGASAGTTGAAPATTAAAPATTTGAPATTALVPSEASRTALTDLKRALRDGQPQMDVLVEHTTFLEKALAERNVFNVRFHAEHLSNIVRGEPIRDLDGNGEASNPGDGVGLAGPNGGYVTGADRPFAVISGDPGVDEVTRGRADRARASVAFMLDRLAAVVQQAERAAGVGGAADAKDEIGRIRAAVDDVETSYKGLRDGLVDYDF
ncbi:MAG: Cytochrome oxidase, cbb3-type, subunit [Gaiellaceae bacterium]|nr:Cytochrome oxidase, cbb3-type, subunit [Gaiellaceae bacterium]